MSRYAKNKGAFDTSAGREIASKNAIIPPYGSRVNANRYVECRLLK